MRPTSGSAISCASAGLSRRRGVQELSRARDQNAAEPLELEQMVIAGDDRVGAGGEGALENPVVGLIVAHDVDHLRGVDQGREAPNRPDSLTDAGSRPPELPYQDGRDLIQDRRRDENFDGAGATEGQDLVRCAGEVQCGDVDVGVSDNAGGTTGRGGPPGRRARRRPPSSRVSLPAPGHSAEALASGAPRRNGGVPRGKARSSSDLPAWRSAPPHGPGPGVAIGRGLE